MGFVVSISISGAGCWSFLWLLKGVGRLVYCLECVSLLPFIICPGAAWDWGCWGWGRGGGGSGGCSRVGPRAGPRSWRLGCDWVGMRFIGWALGSLFFLWCLVCTTDQKGSSRLIPSRSSASGEPSRVWVWVPVGAWGCTRDDRRWSECALSTPWRSSSLRLLTRRFVAARVKCTLSGNKYPSFRLPSCK